jgi:hypothetical protein
MPKSIFKKAQVPLLVLTLLLANMAFLPKVFATTYLSKTSVILTNMNSGGASSIIVEFTTSSSNTGTNGSLVFSGWTGSGGTGTVATSQSVVNTFNSTNCTAITGASANLPGSPTAAGTAATGTIAVTDATALTASTSYCYVLTSGITANPTATGQTNVSLTAGSDAAASDEIDIISNDQVVVSATVPPSFTFAITPGNTDSFTGNLASGSIVGTTGVTATVNTNAKNGWFLWGSDSNTGLKSTTQNYTIPAKTPGTNGSLSIGTEGELSGIAAAGITQGSGAGTTTATTAYASSGSGNGSGLNQTPTQMASSNGTANGASVVIKEYAAISATTPAATDYSDTITLVGAGSF